MTEYILIVAIIALSAAAIWPEVANNFRNLRHDLAVSEFKAMRANRDVESLRKQLADLRASRPLDKLDADRAAHEAAMALAVAIAILDERTRLAGAIRAELESVGMVEDVAERIEGGAL